MIRKFIILSFTVLLFALPYNSWAQDDSDSPPPAGEPDSNDVPCDGGGSLLVIAGIGYGVSKMKKKREEFLEESSK